MIRTFFWVAFAPASFLALIAMEASAQDWAKAMFDHTSYDFGTVARGAKVEHRFPLENIYLEDAHIESIRSSCGCTLAEVTRQSLKTYERSEVVATLDTRNFKGRRDATLTVVFDKPFRAEVQLHIYAYIRSDVVVQPGEARFESVAQGTPARQRLTVSYAGRDNWRIVAVKTGQPYISAKAVELGRNLGQVTYELQVELQSTAPPGYLRDQVILVTDDPDPRTSQVPVMVEAIVTPAIQVRPSPLMLGVLRPGQATTRHLVVQGNAPFQILEMNGPDDRFQFRLPEKPKSVQLVPITFTATESAGKITGTIQIRTDLAGGNALEVRVDGEVLAADPQSPTADVPAGGDATTVAPESLPQPIDPAEASN